MKVEVIFNYRDPKNHTVYLNDAIEWSAFDEQDLIFALDYGRSLEETAMFMQRHPDSLTWEAARRKRLFER